MNTFGHKLEIFCQHEPFSRGIKFWFKHTDWTPDHMTVSVALPLTLKRLTKEDEGMEMPHSMQLQEGEAQQFMDELWRIGLRPREGSGSAGSLAATERHLADMRALVFKTTPQIDGA